MSEKEFFFAMTQQTTKATIFFGLVALVIFLLGKLSWWFGVILFAIFGLVCLVSLLQTVLTSTLSTFMSIVHFVSLVYTKFFKSPALEAEIIEGVSISDQSYGFANGIFHLIAGLVMVVFNFLLYKFFFL